ncbi:hypothetical protein SARC_09549 [Sphaeroforma arctica JP610]|uniref:Uncharacterized protein n=1 Tax=Sphaeroforma arctica JP610 TaxID=667725 RepID=A0A0L0FMM5_9EUKA|nr:hypothetical protein SARC_09549 [Sphaeroforma arctica JP610]KNC78005.1 hypothetical protein SARC_09549 [Sphaeroforma arctica JP610]|eukprot:XP_014151907.1 hypothetical protein SARC_09549 [Sphaeroforma arctica JP610]
MALFNMKFIANMKRRISSKHTKTRDTDDINSRSTFSLRSLELSRTIYEKEHSEHEVEDKGKLRNRDSSKKKQDPIYSEQMVFSVAERDVSDKTRSLPSPAGVRDDTGVEDDSMQLSLNAALYSNHATYTNGHLGPKSIGDFSEAGSNPNKQQSRTPINAIYTNGHLGSKSISDFSGTGSRVQQPQTPRRRASHVHQNYAIPQYQSRGSCSRPPPPVLAHDSYFQRHSDAGYAYNSNLRSPGRRVPSNNSRIHCRRVSFDTDKNMIGTTYVSSVYERGCKESCNRLESKMTDMKIYKELCQYKFTEMATHQDSMHNIDFRLTYAKGDERKAQLKVLSKLGYTVPVQHRWPFQ